MKQLDLYVIMLEIVSDDLSGIENKNKKENEIMKKRIQKYLSGSNEGFSLVELIIVIAIMAILVGVVALAVIPYLEKSRESKDLQALDTLASAATHAVADAKVTGTGKIEINTTGTWPTKGVNETDDELKVINGIKSTLGDTLPTFSSNGCKGVKDLTVQWDTKANVVVAYVPNSVESRKYEATDVQVGTMEGTIKVAACQYNDNALFCISNAKVTGTAQENGGTSTGTGS